MRAREMTLTGKHLLPTCEDQSWISKSKRVSHRHVSHLGLMPYRPGYPVGIQCLEGRDEGASASCQLDWHISCLWILPQRVRWKATETVDVTLRTIR